MADDQPKTPPDVSKVQPKKETVRINLPPKPSMGATVKIPATPVPRPAAPPASPVSKPAPAAGATQKPSPKPSPVSPGARPAPASASGGASTPPGGAMPRRPRAGMSARGGRLKTAEVGGIEKGLGILAVLVLVLVNFYLFWLSRS